jgi:hypothetical protein
MMSATAFLARSTTRLSWLGAHFSSLFGQFHGLARLSLAAVLLSMVSGCLVDDPPPYVAAKKTAPRLDYSRAQPGLDQIIVKNSGEPIPFSIPVTSEDAGDPLSANMLFDYAGDGSVPDFLRPLPLPASTLDDPEERLFKFQWIVRDGISPGCHRFTLRVTHASNVNLDFPEQAIDKADQAEAFWFANINVDPEDASSLVNCPLATTGKP